MKMTFESDDAYAALDGWKYALRVSYPFSNLLVEQASIHAKNHKQHITAMILFYDAENNEYIACWNVADE